MHFGMEDDDEVAEPKLAPRIAEDDEALAKPKLSPRIARQSDTNKSADERGREVMIEVL